MRVQDIEVWYKEHYEQVKVCTHCDLHKTCMKNIPGHGNLSSGLMIVGEAPGADEDLYGIPFVGRSGRLLNEMLEEAGLHRDDFYVTNICKCRPPDNRPPSSIETYTCTAHLRDEILILEPRVVLTLGYTATYCVYIRYFYGATPAGSMSDARRHVWAIPLPRESEIIPGITRSTMLFPTYHPSYCLRNHPMRIQVVNDFKQLKRFIDSGYRYDSIDERKVVWQPIESR